LNNKCDVVCELCICTSPYTCDDDCICVCPHECCNDNNCYSDGVLGYCGSDYTCYYE
jgi:hypothetical protein